MPPPSAFRAVALFEAAKGTLALLGASGVLLLLHHDLRGIALRLVQHTHLNPASRYPRLFLDAVDWLQDMHLWLLVLGVLVYASVRFVEAYGLWHRRAWAEMLAALSGGIYLPFELLELLRRPGWLTATTLTLNAVVVVLMVRALWLRRRSAPEMLDSRCASYEAKARFDDPEQGFWSKNKPIMSENSSLNDQKNRAS
jgi:uncharacterized membrane protein (DUF2068 family)